MTAQALDGLLVVDVAGTVSTAYCAKLYRDYGARVVNLEPAGGFPTRQLSPLVPLESAPDASAMHAYLSAGKQSVELEALDAAQRRRLFERADLLLDDGIDGEHVASQRGVRQSIEWYGAGPYAGFTGTDAQMFALNGMLEKIGHVQGPPLIPHGYQAQVVAGLAAYVASLTQVLAGEIGNRSAPVHIETSIADATMCFFEIGPINYYNTGLEGPRMGINRYPPTYPLGVFPCRDGWLGVTVLAPSQWRAFCELIELPDLADVELFQTSVGRLESRDVLEPMFTEKLLEHSAEDLFYRGQAARIPLARVPTMEELFEVDQFISRQAFTNLELPSGRTLDVPSIPFRLYGTPPEIGGVVAALGEHTTLWR